MRRAFTCEVKEISTIIYYQSLGADAFYSMAPSIIMLNILPRVYLELLSQEWRMALLVLCRTGAGLTLFARILEVSLPLHSYSVPVQASNFLTLNYKQRSLRSEA